MCLSPIKIKNRTRHVVPDATQEYLLVPCGKCSQCRRQQNNDWFVRASAEFDSAFANGSVWFPTLTYSDEYLPHYYNEDTGFECPCFDTSHFTAFRNKLRVYLTRKGYPCKGSTSIRYIRCCEFGGHYGRPHYHVLLFVNRKVPVDVMHDCIKRAWIYGFVQYSNKGMMLSNKSALNYAMKYISKDQVWMTKYHADEYIKYLKELRDFSNDIKDKLLYDSYLREFRKVMPCHKQSRSFGLCGLDSYVNDDNILTGRLSRNDINFKHSGKETKAKFSYWSIPAYYLRKKMFDYDQNLELYKLNEYGLGLLRRRFPDIVDKRTEFVKPYLDGSIAKIILGSKLNSNGCLSSKFSKDEKIISEFFKHCTINDLVLYDLCYRDRSMLPEHWLKFNYKPLRVLRHFLFEKSDAVDMFLRPKMFLPYDKVYPKNSDMRNVNTGDLCCYNSLLPFRMHRFDDILDIVTYYHRLYGSLVEESAKLKEIEDASSIFKHHNYLTL